MADYKGQYVYGTAARKLEYDQYDKYDVYKENKVLKGKKQARTNNRTRLKVILLVAVLFGMCLSLMYRYAIITELNYRISSTYGEYNKLKNENSRLTVDIGGQTDLTKIKEVAENRLGMQKPDKYQVVHVMIPKNDYTVVAEGYENLPQKTDKSLTALFDRVRKFAQLFY